FTNIYKSLPLFLSFISTQVVSAQIFILLQSLTFKQLMQNFYPRLIFVKSLLNSSFNFLHKIPPTIYIVQKSVISRKIFNVFLFSSFLRKIRQSKGFLNFKIGSTDFPFYPIDKESKKR